MILFLPQKVEWNYDYSVHDFIFTISLHHLSQILQGAAGQLALDVLIFTGSCGINSVEQI